MKVRKRRAKRHEHRRREEEEWGMGGGTENNLKLCDARLVLCCFWIVDATVSLSCSAECC